jgi:uncharacterized protein YlzI (FlbEa/FlbD family)
MSKLKKKSSNVVIPEVVNAEKKEPIDLEIFAADVQVALTTIQDILLSVASFEADDHNTILGLIGNKIILNSSMEELNTRMTSLEKQFRILNAQKDFQKVPELGVKLTAITKRLKRK